MISHRLQYIDIAKGICILLVITGHILQFNCCGYGSDTAFNFIYSFHMPVFMLLSGYVAALSQRRIDAGVAIDFIKKKFKSLVPPFFVWGLFISPFIIKQQGIESIISTTKDLILNPSTGAWFIIVLFFIQLYFLLFRLLSERLDKYGKFLGDVIAFFIVMGLLVISTKLVDNCNESIWGIKQYLSIRYFVCFILGYYYQKFGQSIVFNKWIFFISILVFSLLVKDFVFNKSPLYLQMAISICASVVILNVSKQIETTSCLNCKKQYEWLKRIGKSSLVIYLTHFAIITVIPSAVLNTNCIKAIPLFLLCFTISIPISMLCVKWGDLIKEYPIIDFVMYGHSKKQNNK